MVFTSAQPGDGSTSLPPSGPLNVAFLGKRYDTVGGVERNLFELARRFARSGHAVTVYCLEARCPPSPGVRIVRLRPGGPGRLAALWTYAWLGPRRAYAGGHDLVISFARAVRQDIVRNGSGTHRLFLDKMAETGGRWRRWARALDPYHRSLLAIERRQYTPGHYQRIVANAPIVKQDIMDTYGVPDRDIVVIHNGINTDLFHAGVTAHREAVRRRHGLPADAPVALFVGSGYRRKGLEYLLRTAAPLRDRGLRLLIVGAEPAEAEFRQLAAALGLADHACFAGPQVNVNEYYGAADLFTLPSLYEPFGHSTMEALACGLPVIGVRRTGASALLSAALAAYTLDDPRDQPAYTARLEQLLDPARRAALRADALAVAGGYTLDANAAAFESLCREVLAARRTPAAV